MTFAARSVAVRLRRRRGAAALCALVVGTLLPLGPAAADAIAVVNALRTDGCAGEAAIGARVRPNLELDDVARELSHNAELSEAFERAHTPAVRATSLHVRGSTSDNVIRSVLEKKYCTTVEDPGFAEAGVFARGDEIWIVLSELRSAPPALDPATVEQQVLTLVNAARTKGRQCGDETYTPAPPVKLSPRLYEAALEHSRDMATTGVPSHEGSDGSHVGERVTRTSYTWRVAGENVAAGQPDVDSVVAAWLESPGHCATLMAPYFTDMAVAFELAPEKNPSIFWTQVFAVPRTTTAADGDEQPTLAERFRALRGPEAPDAP